MVGLAAVVTPIVCATPLEAEVRELRLIAEHKPRYNRRSRFPERAMWLKLTVEAFPRLSRVREVRDDGATYLGPFSGARQVELATAALHEAFRLRQCTTRLSPRRVSPACALAEMGRCGAPCDGRETRRGVRRARRRRPRGDARRRPPARRRAVSRKVARLAEVERFEEAAVHRDRLAAFVRAAARHAAAVRADRLRRAGRRPAARRRRLGDRRGPARPARGHRGRRPGRGPAGRRRRPWSPPPRSSRRGTGRRRRPRPRRPSACCAGSRQPGTRLVSLTGTWACTDVRRRRRPAVGRGREQRPRPARPVRRPPRHPAGAPAGRRGQPDRLTASVQIRTHRRQLTAVRARSSTSTSPPRTCSTRRPAEDVGPLLLEPRGRSPPPAPAAGGRARSGRAAWPASPRPTSAAAAAPSSTMASASFDAACLLTPSIPASSPEVVGRSRHASST